VGDLRAICGRFFNPALTGYDHRHSGNSVTHVTGVQLERAGRGFQMAAHPIRTNSAFRTSEWNSSSQFYTRSQLTAVLRAALIALVLLGVLAVIVLL
jgi:hypothetical protein